MILFIDDEPTIMGPFREYLEQKMVPYHQQVVFHSNVDEALSFFENRVGEIDLVILDIMMPHGERFGSEKTNGGLKTGIAFYERIRELAPELPVIIFTNFYDEDIERKFRQDSKCRSLQKVDFLLEEFVAEVKQALSLPPEEE